MSHYTDNVQCTTETIIFVTYVEADHECLKIWGQQDKHTATCVERFIYPLVDQFSQGYGCPSKSNPPIIGALCCASFKTDGYYRAKILDIRRDGMIVVQFIDYGNVEALQPNDVHLLDNIPGTEPLQAYPPMATEFILLKVLPINGMWESRTIESIRSMLCYNEYKVLVSYIMNNRFLVKLWYNNEDFCDVLIRERLALSATVQEMCRIRPFLQQDILMYQQQNESNMNNFTTAPVMQTTNINQNTSMQRMYHKTPPVGVTQHKHVAPQTTHPVQEALVFKSRVLDVGSIHEVLVSSVEDGPQKFSVQVQSTTEVLANLMRDINNRPKKPLQEPPLPGSVCLGCYTKDKILCRAVVMSVMEHKCKLYYVDFGHTEVLSYTDIFQLPPEFINPKVLSIRFTLSGLKELNITQEMKDYFKELVSRKLLYLHVRPPEGPPLIQYGDLYDNNVNVKDILKKAFPTPATVPMTYSYPQLRRLTKDVQEIVQVSFVESCKKFFVQLDSGAKSLESIMTGLAQYSKTAVIFSTAQLKVGLPCAALYESEWYRAQILNITGDKVKVVYVDYGNEEILPVSSLRMIHDDLVNKLPAQAIKCALNGYEVLSQNQEVINHFEKLTLEKRFYMKVVASQPNGLLVDLFEFETMRSIHPQLLNNIFCDKTRENSISSQNEEIHTFPKTTNLNNSQSGDRDKYIKKGNADLWNRAQNTKPSQENKPKLWKEKQTNATDDWSPEKQHDNRRERTTSSYSSRENPQNNRYTNKEESNHRSVRTYNKYDKAEVSTSSRRGAIRGDRNRFSGSESRYNRNNSIDKSWSDKDSDTSSRGSGKRGRSGFNRGSRGGRREGRTPNNKLESPRWNDRSNDKPSYNKNGRSYGDYGASGNKFGNKENEMNDVPYNKMNTETFDNIDKEPSSKVVSNEELCFASLNIALGAVRNCEVVFTNSPSDFFVQLSPDYLELESVMVSIARAYENSGEIIQITDVKCGMCCVAQYKEDLQWYRATVVSVDRSNATVQFVDYGNTESVDFTKLKVIQEEFLKLPAQAVHCKLLGLTNTGNKENENTLFETKIEGKSLEVEFIAQKNGIYEVLLREVADGASKANYINEEFCTSEDLTKTREVATNKMISNVTAKRTHETLDYAPFNTKWQMTVYEPASKHDVIVTWFINPNKFYCQTLTNEAEFKTMMNDIQVTYNGRKSVTHKLEIGSAVIAIFPEDEALYRAEVVGKTQMGYIVKYIDFGNCATVNPCNIYPVEKKFMRLPKLVTQCTLKNIVPCNDSSWSNANNDALDNCFNADKYECTFHSVNDDLYIVSLIHNGQDVSNMLVQRNLATFATEETGSETVNVATEALSVETTTLCDADKVEKVDVNLLSGQTLKMKVSNVESITQFHIQFPSAAKCESIIDKYMADKDTKVMPRLSSREMCLGTGCLVNTNGTWRRAVVINLRSVGFDVKLIDTGAYDEILDDALALPGVLAVMQNQTLECSLQNMQSSPDVDKRLKELVEGKEVLVYVAEVDNIKLIVKLYDLLGNEIMSTDENSKKISPICPMPILSSTHHKVCVSCADHSSSIWLQRYSDYKLDTQLLADLEQYYTNSGQRLKPEANLLCAARSSNNQWYRGRIISYTETSAYVNYIDYGNTEEVSLELVMALEPQFYEPYQLAVNASLSVTLAGSDAEQANILHEHLMNKDLTAVFYNVHNKWIVHLIENGEKVSDKFHSLNLLKKEQAIPQQSSFQKQTTSAIKFEVCIPYIDSPSQFWLQRADSITYLNENQKLLQLEVANYSMIEGIPEEGTLCAAIYSIDDNWYRAEVLDADEDITTVRFIDYGNTDIIDTKAGHIRQLPDNWKNIGQFAIKCRLDVIPIDTEDWCQATCDRFENLVTSVDFLQAVIIADTVPRRVELFVNDKNVSEIMVAENHAIMINAEAEPVDEIVDLVLDPHSAFVCHINSPSEFWVQEEESVADLEVMTDRFIMADMFPKIDDVKEGLLCVAKYPEDTQWYRARVLSHDNNNIQVIYIDYGNSSLCTEIRALPPDLADIPPLSRKCCLELPPHVKEWSEEACQKFNELAADGATIFILDVLKEQETSLVKLTLDKQNVNDILANLCEQHLEMIEERLPPLGEENSPNVVVSHINSPSEFWIQAESSISELEVMSDRLRDAQSFLTLSTYDVNTICAALYPEDGCWYRAKIIACRDEKKEVLYIDYGNSAVTEELRVLPQDIVDIPILSKRCALEKLPHVVVWSEEACEKFKNLAAEGATMFQFETLDEEDPMHVRLNLNGTNVVDLLLTECQKTLEVGEVIKVESTASAVEEQNKIAFDESGENYQPTNKDSEETTAERKLIFNQEIPNTNLNCINEKDKTDNIVDDKMINKSFDDFERDVDKKGVAEEKQKHTTDYSEIEKLDEDTETTKSVSVINKDTEDLNVESKTGFEEFKSSVVLELSVDDIIENMVKHTADESDTLKIDGVAIANESHSVVPDDVTEQQELLPQVQSVDIDLGVNEEQSQSVIQNNAKEQESHSQIKYVDTNKLSDVQSVETANTNERISDSAKNIIEDSDSNEILLSVTNQTQSQDITQFDTSQVEEDKAHFELQPDENDLPESQLLETFGNTSSLLEEKQMSLSQQSQELSAAKNEIINDNTNKKSDSEVTLQDTSKNDSSNFSQEAICTTIATASQSEIKTDPVRHQFLNLRSRSEDKIVPGCISRGESPDLEATMCLLTPKIPCSEKTTDNMKSLHSTIDSTNKDD